jgi:hypothetical protein
MAIVPKPVRFRTSKNTCFPGLDRDLDIFPEEGVADAKFSAE